MVRLRRRNCIGRNLENDYSAFAGKVAAALGKVTAIVDKVEDVPALSQRNTNDKINDKNIVSTTCKHFFVSICKLDSGVCYLSVLYL